MEGFEVLKARRSAKLTQEQLRRALGLVHRCTLTDIESGAVEITDAYGHKILSTIEQLKQLRTGRL